MTSRRKQVKPIKASCSTVEICDTKIQSISSLENTEHQLAKWQTLSLDTEKVPEEEIIELEATETVKIAENFQIEDPIEEQVEAGNDCTKIDDICLQNVLDESLDEITKKMNKDEAKILPFQSSGGVDFFKCPLCDQSYICGRESLTIHLQEHQNKMKRDDGKHLCCLCSKELSSNSSLERHLLTHSNHRPFSCYMCDKKFTTNGNLSRHIKTSHSNNETIESSIDEVLKKHQSEADKIANDSCTDPKLTKAKKPSKSLRKDNDKLDEKSLIPPMISVEDPIITEPIYKAILPSNFFPPLLLNINELPFFQPHRLNTVTNIRPECTANVSTVAATIDRHERPINQIKEKKRFGHLKSITGPRRRQRMRFFDQLEIHYNRLRKIKRRSWRFRTRCSNCWTVFLDLNGLLLHIRNCYSNTSSHPLFCPLRMCNRKFLTKPTLIKHIKVKHLKQSNDSPVMEPLNLSMKSSRTEPKPLVNDQLNIPQVTIANSCPQPTHPSLKKELLHNIIDYSISSNLPWNIPNPAFFKTTCSHISTFPTTNQFISSSPILTSSPISLTTSFKADWCPLNQYDINDNNIINLDPMSPKSDLQMQINNLSIRNPINASIAPISRNGLDNVATKPNSMEFNSANSLVENARLKFGMGIKKKNSYKDAPKLITCPMEGCVQKFPWNSSLMRHILTHTAHKPFKCTRCTKCFSTKSNRERHMTRVHGVRINRSKFKSLQATKTSLDECSKVLDEAVDSESGNCIDDSYMVGDKDINITELSEEEWIIMDNNDRRAEDISNNLLKLAGQPVIEPNPVRLNNNQITMVDKTIPQSAEYSFKIHPFK